MGDSQAGAAAARWQSIDMVVAAASVPGPLVQLRPCTRLPTSGARFILSLLFYRGRQTTLVGFPVRG
jgi:hypothetical protein